MKLDSSGQERGRDLLMERQCCVHQLLHVSLHLVRETSTGHVALQDTQVDGSQRVHLHRVFTIMCIGLSSEKKVD